MIKLTLSESKFEEKNAEKLLLNQSGQYNSGIYICIPIPLNSAV